MIHNALMDLSKLHLKRALLMRHLVQMCKYFSKIKERIKKECSRDLKSASKYALHTGNWLDFQQARWWAERLKIDAVVLADQDNYEAPPPKSEYDHLGYHVAQSGVFRDKLQNLKGRLSFQKNRLLFNSFPYRLDKTDLRIST
ncbi:MAG: hypothetical protein ACE5IY_21280 [bacterium]